MRLGMRSAWRRRGLVILVWALFLAAALLAASPAWRWWNGTLSVAPEGDRLLDGLNAPLLRELSHYDRSSTYAVAFASVAAFLLAMLVLNPFVAGGMLSVLRAAHDHERDENGTRFTSAPRVSFSSWMMFFRGGAGHYGLFLRMLLIAGIFFGLLAGLFVLALLPIMHYVEVSNWEQPFLLVGAAFPVAVAIAWWLASLLLDIGRIRAMREGERRSWRAMRGAVRFVWRNAGATLALGVAFAVLTALTFGVYFIVASSFTPKSWPAILLAIVWQQALSLARTGLRVSLLAGELELVSAREPIRVEARFTPSLTADPPPSGRPPPDPPTADLPPLA